MISPYAVLGMTALLLLMVGYASIADAYDAERWKTDPDYCRYAGSFRQVMTWWWGHRT